MIGTVRDDVAGMHRSLDRLVQALIRYEPIHEYVLVVNFFRGSNRREFARILELSQSNPNVTVKRSYVPNQLMERMPLPISVFGGNVDVFHCPSHETYRVPIGRKVMTIHDLRPYFVDDSINPEWVELLRKEDQGRLRFYQYRQTVAFYKRLRRRLARSIRDSTLIITPSEYTKATLQDRFRIEDCRIRVIPWGVDDNPKPPREDDEIERRIQACGIRRPFVLAVGRLDPQKNLLRLIGSFASLKKDAKLTHSLVIVGRRNWFFPILENAVRKHGLAGDVVNVENINDDDLACFYRAAAMLVFPSLFEGFGFPPLEAMVYGCPIVASNAGPIPDLVGDAAVLIDPMDTHSIAQGILRLAGNSQLRETLRQRGFERVKKFTWERTARETMAAYRYALESSE
jgi:glycosyltransferase involved in cell wall biosynthesis